MEDKINQLTAIINIQQDNINNMQHQINQLYETIKHLETKYIITE